MLEQKEEKENKFVFRLFMGDKVIYERSINANVYNHGARYSVNIRELSVEFIDKLTDILTEDPKKLDYGFYGYDLSNYDTNLRIFKNFAMVLYYNDSIVINRRFRIEELNYNNIKSNDFVYLVEGMVEMIQQMIKEKDINQMWEEYYLINHYRMTIPDIRQLDNKTKKSMLRKITV